MAQIKIRIKKLQEKLSQEQNELKSKKILLQGIIKKYNEYKQLEKKDEKQYEQVQKQLINLRDQSYQQSVETQDQKYQITLLNFEVDKKAFEKAPFNNKQQFLAYKQQDQQALFELSKIKKEKEKFHTKQKECGDVAKKIQSSTKNIEQIQKNLNHNRYQRIYYEQMRDDAILIIQQKQNYIRYISQTIQEQEQALEYWNYEQECKKYEQNTFLQCQSKNDYQFE